MHAFFKDLAEPTNYCKGRRAIVATSMKPSDRKAIVGYKEDSVRVD